MHCIKWELSLFIYGQCTLNNSSVFLIISSKHELSFDELSWFTTYQCFMWTTCWAMQFIMYIYIFMMYKLTACSCWLLSQLTEELQHQLFNGPFSFMSNFNPCPSNIDQFQSCLHHRLWNKGISIANWGVLNFYNCTYNLFYSETSTTESALLQSTLLGWSD